MSITDKIKGIVHITGEPDSGKTTFCLTTGIPVSQTVFVGDDVKESSVVSDLMASGTKFLRYHNLKRECDGMRELEMHEYCLKIIEELKTLSPKLLIWDTWTRFENTFHPFVVANMLKFRTSWSSMGEIKGAQQWQESFEYEAEILAKMVESVPLILLTTHLKMETIGKIKTGRYIPDCKKPLAQKTHMRLWLKLSDTPEPVGLVLKRPSIFNVKQDGSLEAINVLPRRVYPCTWNKIRWYYENPVGNRKLTEDETPNEYELSVIDGMLTADQKEMLKMLIESKAFEDDDSDAEVVKRVLSERVQKLASEGKTPPQIAGELGITVQEVITYMS
ncbi:MAG: hypothetical protein HPY87_10105 [Fervidobacterium sp.]|uniref:hypothetical protein n=1 Tax=Fervidobacterium sp. TaxID=1871331 RepID=UPI0025BB3C78|nr:hypothetical protein [Fervidobacterium sp.]NPU90212.1 hypothetical protein [Fervidobacterium sp.]